MMHRPIMTRTCWPMFALAALSTPACGQGAVTFAELDGALVDARLIREQVVRREGREFPVKAQGDYRLVLGPGDKIHLTFIPTAHTARGQRQGETRSGLFTLDQSREVKGSGPGQAVWTYADQTLTMRRTFKQGAYRMNIVFARSSDGFTCTASEAFARENGVGAIVLDSSIDGVPTTIISAKQVSSTCRVTKR